MASRNSFSVEAVCPVSKTSILESVKKKGCDALDQAMASSPSSRRSRTEIISSLRESRSSKSLGDRALSFSAIPRSLRVEATQLARSLVYSLSPSWGLIFQPQKWV
nr:hypothetical protein [Thermanaerovibrio acidaminovorans]